MVFVLNSLTKSLLCYLFPSLKYFYKKVLTFLSNACIRKKKKNRRTACWIVTHIPIWIVVFMVNVMKLCKAEFKFIIHQYLNREIVFTWGNWSCWLSQSRNEEIDDSYCSCCSWTLTAELSHLHSSADLDLLQGNTVLFKIPQVFRLVIVCWSGG